MLLARLGRLSDRGERREAEAPQEACVVLDVFFELIELLPKKAQWIIAGLIAALLIAFLGYLVYLYFTGGLW